MTDITVPRAAIARYAPLARLGHPREVVRQFTPNWFAATMGTGALALCIGQAGAHAPALRAVAETLWLANIGLFALFSALYAARWVLYFDEARRIFDHSVMSMFFGCVPMGLATIINGLMAFGAARWGRGAIDLAHALWWIDAALSVACGLGVPFLMFTRQTHSVEQMTAVWLLPLVAAEVASVSAGLLAPHLADPSERLTVLACGYVLWALSVPLAMSVLVVLVLRMAVHKLPHAGMAATSWLALGPIGTGALGLLVLGAAAPGALGAYGLGGAGEVVRGLGLVGGLVLWGYGAWWAAMGVMVTVRYLREGLPFNLGWWGYTFPIGVYALATLRLAGVLPIPAIALIGRGLVLALAAIWMIVAARTLAGAWRGELFSAPCLAQD